MSENLALLIYKLSCLTVGYFNCYLGYRLFTLGVWGRSGDLESNFGKNKLILKSAAPGTFFVVLGSCVIGATIVRGMSWKKEDNSTNFQTTLAQPNIVLPPIMPPEPEKNK